MKPARTFGLSLAILASVMLFTILPMLQVATILIIRYHIQNADLPMPGSSTSVAPLASGGDFTGIPDATLIIQTVLGIVFLGIAFCAWRGRPRWIRLAMWASVVVLTLVTAILSVTALLTDPDLNQGIDSAAAISQTLLSGRLLLSILVALYVVWYMNRGPARAFYRGYFLTEADQPLAKQP